MRSFDMADTSLALNEYGTDAIAPYRADYARPEFDVKQTLNWPGEVADR